MMRNTLCNGLIKNNNPASPIEYFELVTVREFTDYEGGTIIDQISSAEQFLDTEEEAIDEPFYQIYGKRYEYDDRYQTIFLGEFYSLDKAKEFLYNLTGEVPQIISY
jgi:hypothetical protein